MEIQIILTNEIVLVFVTDNVNNEDSCKFSHILDNQAHQAPEIKKILALF